MTDSICSYLQNRIRDFVANRDESYRWFARQSGVDYSTVYRLQAGEQRSLSFQNATKILRVIEPASYISILRDFYPFETSELANSATEKTDEFVDLLASDLNLYRVFVQAEVPGTARSDIRDKFGSDGIAHLERLIKAGVLLESEKGFVSALEGAVYPSEAALKRVSMHHYSMIQLDTPGSFIENVRCGLSKEGVAELHAAGVEYREKAHRIMRDNKGDILTVASLISGPANCEGKE